MKPYKHKVQYYETDQMVVVHHSNYIRWFEEARVELLERIGMSYDRLEREGLISPVLGVKAQYKSMVRFGDSVEITPHIEVYNGIKLTISYLVADAATKDIRCLGQTRHCFLNAEGKPVSLKRSYPHYHELLLKLQQTQKALPEYSESVVESQDDE